MRLCRNWMLSGFLLLTFGNINLVSVNGQNTPLPEDATQIAPTIRDEETIPGLQPFTATRFDSGNVSWVTVGTVAGLCLMTSGMLLFYGGLFHTRNLAQLAANYLLLISLLSVSWILLCYSLAFSRNVRSHDVTEGEILAPEMEKTRGNPYIGGMDHAVLRGLDSQIGFDVQLFPIRRPSDTIPHLLFMFFQMACFIAAPAPLVAAMSDSVRFSRIAVFCLAWGAAVYSPIAYWIWGGGWLGHVLDTAGGNGMHVSVGISAWVLGFFLSPRAQESSTPSLNSSSLVLGTVLYWCGTIFSNGARSFAADGFAVNSCVTTHLAACAGVLGWTGTEWMLRGKSDLLGLCAGGIAGMIAISSGCGYVAPQSSLLIGLLGGAACFGGYSLARKRWGDNLSWNVSAIHLSGGMLGVLLTGVFATAAVSGFDRDGHPVTGLIAGNSGQLLQQAIAIGCTVILSMVNTLAICLAIRWTIGFGPLVSGVNAFVQANEQHHRTEIST